MVAKVSLGIIGIGAISIGGVAFTKPEWLGINKEIIWKPLSQDEGFDDSDASSPYNGKFGSTYKNYLVGTSQGNKAWWNEKVKNIKENDRKGKFKKIKQGFDETDSLKELCNEAYKKSENDLKTNEDPGNDEFKKSDVWKYCSAGGTQPQTIDEFNTANSSSPENYSTESAIGTSDQKTKLLSINSTNNGWIWDLKDKEFVSAEVTEGFFKAEKEKPNRKSIKDICKDAYGKKSDSSSDTDTEVKKETVIKYCSLEKK